MDISEKLFDGHVHTLMRVPVRESIDIYKQEFEELGVEKAVFLSCPLHEHGEVEMDKLQNIKCLFYKAYFKQNGYAYCALEHDFNMPIEKRAQYYLDQAKENLANGFDGYKLLEGMPKYLKKIGVNLAHEVYEPFWAYLEKQGTPIIIHNAHPKKFWDREAVSEYWIKRGCFYGDGTYPDFYEIINAIFEVLDRHPNLKITLAHMGFLETDYDLAVKFMSYKNTMFDVTPGGAFLEYANGDMRKEWIDFIIKYSDRIKYGTDLYNFDKTTEAEWKRAFHARPDFVRQFLQTDTEHVYAGTKFTGINLDKKYRDKIYRENLEKELGQPKPINFDWAINKIKELRKEFSDTETLDGYDLMCMEYDFNSLK